MPSKQKTKRSRRWSVIIGPLLVLTLAVLLVYNQLGGKKSPTFNEMLATLCSIYPNSTIEYKGDILFCTVRTKYYTAIIATPYVIEYLYKQCKQPAVVYVAKDDHPILQYMKQHNIPFIAKNVLKNITYWKELKEVLNISNLTKVVVPTPVTLLCNKTLIGFATYENLKEIYDRFFPRK